LARRTGVRRAQGLEITRTLVDGPFILSFIFCRSNFFSVFVSWALE